MLNNDAKEFLQIILRCVKMFAKLLEEYLKKK